MCFDCDRSRAHGLLVKQSIYGLLENFICRFILCKQFEKTRLTLTNQVANINIGISASFHFGAQQSGGDTGEDDRCSAALVIFRYNKAELDRSTCVFAHAGLRSVTPNAASLWCKKIRYTKGLNIQAYLYPQNCLRSRKNLFANPCKVTSSSVEALPC